MHVWVVSDSHKGFIILELSVCGRQKALGLARARDSGFRIPTAFLGMADGAGSHVVEVYLLLPDTSMETTNAYPIHEKETRQARDAQMHADLKDQQVAEKTCLRAASMAYSIQYLEECTVAPWRHQAIKLDACLLALIIAGPSWPRCSLKA